MHSQIPYGQLVKVWPLHEKVQNGETAHERFMPLAGREVRWDAWWRSQAIDGAIAFTDPRVNHRKHTNPDDVTEKPVLLVAPPVTPKVEV